MQEYKIADILDRIKEPVDIKDGQTYNRIKIRMYHKGVFLRDKVKGEEIKTKKQCTARLGQFIMSKIDAKDGACGIVPESLDGAIVTNDFLLFVVNTQYVDAHFFKLYTKTTSFKELCIKASMGTTNRQRLKEELFLNFKIKLPSMEKQISIVSLYESLENKNDDIMTEIDRQSEYASQLRKTILQLAIQGKLVKQDPSDEPASILLEKIREEKERQILEKKIKKEKPLPPITEDEVPFELPKGWEWCRIGDCMSLINGKAFKPTEWSETGLPIIRIQNLNNANAPYNYCTFKVDEKFIVNDGDILIGWSGTPGTSFGAFIWDRGSAVLNQHIFKSVPYHKEISWRFLMYAINSKLNEMISKAHGGVGLQHITKGKFENIIISLPPLNEQLRIVKKLDQLMAYCDKLEETINQSKNHSETLMDGVLQEAFN